MGKFVIKKTPTGGFNFSLYAANKEKIAVASQVYTTKAACKKGMHKYQCAMVNIFFTFKYEHEALTTSAEYRHERQKSMIKFRNYVILFENITL